MSGPNPPGPDSEGSDTPEQEPGEQPAEDLADRDATGQTDIHSQAYSAPESEQFTAGPYVPADPGLYDYDDYDQTELVDTARPPRWPWVVGIVAIIAAVSLVVSVSMLVTGNRLRQPRDAGNEHDDIGAAGAGRDHHHDAATAAPATAAQRGAAASATGDRHGDAGAASAAPAARGRTAATAGRDPAPPPPPPTTTRSGPRQVTYSVTGTKAPGDIITVTYVDASGRSRTQRNVYIPWSLTVTPISQSEVGSVQASSLFLVSRLNCSITTSDGTVLSSNTGNSAQTSC